MEELPYEVMQQIVELLQNEGGSWCSALKQMYSIYQSFKFKNVCINLNAADNFLNLILNSIGQPNQYVKKKSLSTNFLHQTISTRLIQQMTHFIN